LEKIEEIKLSLDFLEGGAIKNLKVFLMSYVDTPDEESNKSSVDTELNRILEAIEINKKA
jgi:hypothetical protein